MASFLHSLVLLITSSVLYICDGSDGIQRCLDKDNILCKATIVEFVHGIRVINISNKNLTQLHPGSLSELTNFTRVDLSNNSITEIKNNVFSNMDFVTVDLSFNNIDVIESEAFDNMTELRKLRLDFNRIKAWDSAWFKNNRNLHQISFRGNLIREVPSRAFQNIRWIHNYDIFLRVVTTVDLSDNDIENIFLDIFGDETEIGGINFANNSISSVPRNLFLGVQYVEELVFRHNQLECDTIIYLLNVDNLDSVDLRFQNTNIIN